MSNVDMDAPNPFAKLDQDRAAREAEYAAEPAASPGLFTPEGTEALGRTFEQGAAKWVAPEATAYSIMGHALTGDQPYLAPQLTPQTTQQAVQQVTAKPEPTYGGALGIAQNVARDVSNPLGQGMLAVAPGGELAGAVASGLARNFGAPEWMQDVIGAVAGIGGGAATEKAAQLARDAMESPYAIAKSMVPDAHLNETGLSSLIRNDAKNWQPRTVGAEPHADWIENMETAGQRTTPKGGVTYNYPTDAAMERLRDPLDNTLDMRGMELRYGKLAFDPQLANARRAIAANHAMHVTDRPELWHYTEDANGMPATGLSRMAKGENGLGFNQDQINVLDRHAADAYADNQAKAAAGAAAPTTGQRVGEFWHKLGDLGTHAIASWRGAHMYAPFLLGGGAMGAGMMEMGAPWWLAAPTAGAAGRYLWPTLRYGATGGPNVVANALAGTYGALRGNE